MTTTATNTPNQDDTPAPALQAEHIVPAASEQAVDEAAAAAHAAAREQIEDWLDQIEADGKTENTVRAYRRDLLHFHAHLTQAAGVHAFDQVEPHHLASYLDAGGLSLATRARRFASLRGFFFGLVAAGVLAESPVDCVERPAASAKLATAPVPTAADVRRIVERSPEGGRDRAVLELLAAGLTPAEVLSLALPDISLEDGTIAVRGRAGTKREVAIPAPAIDALRRYVASDRSNWYNGARHNTYHAFLSATGRPLERFTIWKLVREYAAAAGVGDVSPNDLRRARIAAMLRDGHEAEDVAAVAGHRDAGATERYRALTERAVILPTDLAESQASA